MQPKPPAQRQIKLEPLSDPSGTYANTVMISHNQFEVFFDFIQMVPQEGRAKVQERIIMTPVHAKMFMDALAENFRRYEEKFGDVKIPPRPQSLADQLFKGVVSGSEGEDEQQPE